MEEIDGNNVLAKALKEQVSNCILSLDLTRQNTKIKSLVIVFFVKLMSP